MIGYGNINVVHSVMYTCDDYKVKNVTGIQYCFFGIITTQDPDIYQYFPISLFNGKKKETK